MRRFSPYSRARPPSASEQRQLSRGWKRDSLAGSAYSSSAPCNDSYAELLEHYGLHSTLVNSGESHENGVAEQAHYRLKDALDQALMLRGSRDFISLEEYSDFVRKVMDWRNRLVQEKLEQELPHLQCLPPAPVPEWRSSEGRIRS